MFQEKTLIIPDNVLPTDVETIRYWFEYYDIAKVDKVTFYLHEEPEYYVEDKNDYYGYAIVEIKEWLYNNCAFNFYENIYNLNGKMVFDDPYYWDVEFADTSKYNNRQYSDTNTYDYSNNESYVPKSPTPSERSDNESYVPNDYSNNESYVPKSPTPSERASCTTEYLESEEEEEEDYEEEDDVNKDSDYVYESDDNELDYEYEYCSYNDNYFDKLDKSRGKKQKTKNKVHEETEVDDVAVVINKNYMKKNKRKDFKNAWVRRLRQKHEIEY